MNSKKTKGYWSRERVEEESKKYTSRGEFRKCCPRAYTVSLKNGWLDSFTWLQRKQDPYRDKLDNVYVYLFEQQHSVYVGRTIHPNDRNIFHHISGTVFKFATDNNIPIPPMVILESGLPLEEGLKREDYYVNKYREEGWNVLNKAKTGVGCGSLGGCIKKWTKSRVEEESKKYGSRSEFSKGCTGAYGAARKNGWLDSFTWLKQQIKPNGYWSRERVEEESKKYGSRSEFEEGCISAYNVSRKNGWLDSFTWLKQQIKPNGYWTYENCKQEALKYTSVSEFKKQTSAAYNTAYLCGYLRDFTWLYGIQKPKGYWSYENCKQEALKYINKNEFHKKCGSAYNVSRKNGWLDDFYPKTHQE